MDRGRVVETGRHDELLARGGAYARLHRSQNNAALDTGELRLPLWEEQRGAPAPVDAYGKGYAYGHEAYAPTYPAPHAPAYAPGHVPSALPDGRPLFRDEEAWPGT